MLFCCGRRLASRPLLFLSSFRYIFSVYSAADLKIADPALAPLGRRRIALAELEMPGLMALRERFASQQPLRGARITGCLHMTVETAVLVETLLALGAEVRWASCNIFSTQDDAAAALALGDPSSPFNPSGVPVFAWRGETLEEYWWCVSRALDWPDGGPNLLLDDGGDATLFVHKGAQAERAGFLPEADSLEEQAMLDALAGRMAPRPGYFTGLAEGILGVSEETTTGVLRLRELSESGELLFPAVNVNDSVTKSKFDNLYGCRHSLPDGLNRALDLMLAGKLCVVCGFGDVGKGSAEALRAQGARVVVTEIDPICALQAAMQGFQVVHLDDVLGEADLFVTATGNRDVISAEHMARMKHNAVVGNIGHFDNELEVSGLPGLAERVEVKPQVDQWLFEDGHAVVVLSEGRLLNLGNATGHPAFVMSASFTNQVLAQLELFSGAFGPGVHVLPRELDEQVARLHLPALGAALTELTAEQAAYIGVPVQGPYKSDDYRY